MGELMLQQEERGLSGSVKHDIEIKIIKGEYAAGERIPPIRKIAEIYGIGMTTATKILLEMSSDGTIYQRRGVGYFVKPYVRDNLIAKYKIKLEKMIIEAFEYADMIDADPMIIVNKINETKIKR